MVEMRGFVFQSDAILSVAAALLTFLLLVSLLVKSNEHFSRSALWAQKEQEACALSDLVAKRLVFPDGNIDVDALSHLTRENSQIRVGNSTVGPVPPANASIFFFRRIVFVDGKPEVMEVRSW